MQYVRIWAVSYNGIMMKNHLIVRVMVPDLRMKAKW